ncbi:MAG: hypothetical protein ACRCX2_38080 [Paraclostridium sp.]
MKYYVVNMRKRTEKHVELQTYMTKCANEVDRLIDGKSIRDYEVIEVTEEELNKGACRII